MNRNLGRTVLLLAAIFAAPALVAADDVATATEPLFATAEAAPGCSAPLEGTLFASAGKGGSTNLTCTADCGSSPDVTCTAPGTCTAVDQSCPGTQGWVACSTGITYCPPCPGAGCNECTNGQFRNVPTGNCCDCGLAESERQECIDTCWVTIGTICKPNASQCPWCP